MDLQVVGSVEKIKGYKGMCTRAVPEASRTISVCSESIDAFCYEPHLERAARLHLGSVALVPQRCIALVTAVTLLCRSLEPELCRRESRLEDGQRGVPAWDVR